MMPNFQKEKTHNIKLVYEGYWNRVTILRALNKCSLTTFFSQLKGWLRQFAADSTGLVARTRPRWLNPPSEKEAGQDERDTGRVVFSTLYGHAISGRAGSQMDSGTL
jgi:hypothetical protein